MGHPPSDRGVTWPPPDPAVRVRPRGWSVVWAVGACLLALLLGLLAGSSGVPAGVAPGPERTVTHTRTVTSVAIEETPRSTWPRFDHGGVWLGGTNLVGADQRATVFDGIPQSSLSPCTWRLERRTAGGTEVIDSGSTAGAVSVTFPPDAEFFVTANCHWRGRD